MKLTVYREAFSEAGVTLLERGEETVSLERVLRNRLGSLEVLRGLEIPALRQSETDDGSDRERRDESMIFRQHGERPRLLRGLVCADAPELLASFMLASCEPTGDTPLAQLLARSREKQGALARRHFVAALGVANEQARQSSQTYLPAIQRYSPEPAPETDTRYPFITKADLDRTFTSVDVGEGPARVARARNGTLVWTPTTLTIGGHAIRRLAFVIPLYGREPAGALVFDGASFRRVRSLGEIPDDLATELERVGSIASRTDLDLFPSPHLRARALVRVPPGSELRNLRPDPRRPPIRELEHPAFVLDSRLPVRLARELPVLEAPEIAQAVLTRTSSGIYLPDEVPERLPEFEKVPEEVTWLVLCEVGGPL